MSVDPLGTRSRSPCVCLVGLFWVLTLSYMCLTEGETCIGFFLEKTSEIQEETVQFLQIFGTGTQAPDCREVTTLAALLAGDVAEK